MNDFTPFEDGFVNEVEDVIGRNEIDNKGKLVSMNMKYDSLYLKLSKLVFFFKYFKEPRRYKCYRQLIK